MQLIELLKTEVIPTHLKLQTRRTHIGAPTKKTSQHDSEISEEIIFDLENRFDSIHDHDRRIARRPSRR